VSEQEPTGGRRRRGARLLGEPAAPAAPRARRPAGEVPPALRRAALAVGLEALLLAVVAGYVVVLEFVSRPTSQAGALGLITYVSIAAAVLAAGAVGLWRGSSWARGPVVVLQILLGLLGYNAAFPNEMPQIGLPALVLVAVTLYLLLTPEARLAYLRDDDEE
jgi:hypothetical protein